MATCDDAPALVDFHNTYYARKSSPEHNRWIRKPEHWLWEYQTYAPGKAVFLMAEKDGQVLATDAGIPIYMEFGGKTILATKGENTLCLESYRGTGLMQAMNRYAVNKNYRSHVDINWASGFITKAIGIHDFTTIFCGIETWIRPCNNWMAIGIKMRDNVPFWKRIGSTCKLALRTLLKRNSRTIAQIIKEPDYDIKQGQIPLEDMNQLRERLRVINKNVIWIKYDSRFINWRIREHPFLKYDEYQVYQNDKLLAYALVTMHGGEAYISDFLSEDPHATSLLLATILKDFENKVGRLRYIGNPKDLISQNLFEQLPEFGFSLAMKWRLSINDRVGDMNKEFYQIRNWNVNGLWTEGFSY